MAGKLINFTQQEHPPMIEIKTAKIEELGFGDFQEIAPFVYRDNTTSVIIISQGNEAVTVKITAE